MRTRLSRWLVVSAVALGALAALSPGSAVAQDLQAPPDDPQADWAFLFERGMDKLREGKKKGGKEGTALLNDSVAAFSSCTAILPQNAVAYYNVACGYSLLKKPKKACEWLKKSFDKGFLDLAHVGRDTDLDPIREDDGFKELVSATRKKILDERPAALRVSPKNAKNGEKLPLLVFLHSSGVSVAEVKKTIAPLADELSCVILLPSGRSVDATGNARWDTTAETCVVADVEAILDDPEQHLDPTKVVLAGELEGARLALSIGCEHGWKRVVTAAGMFYDKVEAGKAKDLRLYAIATTIDERVTSSTREVRDELLAAGAAVAVERHAERSPFPKDGVAALVRGARWALGFKVEVPGDGAVRKF